MKYIFNILLITFLTTNCKTYKRVESIRTCVENSRKISLDYVKDFSIYESYTLFENLLVKKGFLKKDSKESYINLLRELKLNNNKMLKLKKQMNSEMKNFDLLSGPNTSNISFFCVEDYLINGDLDKNKTAIYRKSFNNLLVDNTEKNIEFVKNTPDYLFNDFNFRLPILNIIYIKLIYINGNEKVKS